VPVYKRLRIIIPAVQLLAIVGLLALRWSLKGSASYQILRGLHLLVHEVNYPIWTVFVAMLVRATQLLSPLPRWLYVPTWIYAVLAFVVAALLALGIALLWYLLITEVEMRRHGKSVMRFSSRWKELLVVTILFLFGAGALVRAYTIASSVIHGRMSYLGLFLRVARWDEILAMLILAAWGIVLTGVAVHDLIAFLKGKSVRAATTEPL
jgi:hypothetical protein